MRRLCDPVCEAAQVSNGYSKGGGASYGANVLS